MPPSLTLEHSSHDLCAPGFKGTYKHNILNVPEHSTC